MFRNSLIFTIVLLISGSCQKSVTEKLPGNLSRTASLIERPWRLIKFEKKINTDPWIDLFPGFDDCDKDDITVFYMDHTYNVLGGPSKCDPTEPAIIDIDNWDLIENDTKLLFDSFSEPHQVEFLGENKLVIILAKETSPGVYEQFRSTYIPN